MLFLNWMGPYKVLAVGPYTPADTPDGFPLGDKLLYLDLPSDIPGADARRRVSVQRCKSCANPHDHGDMPTYFPGSLTQYVLFNNFSKKSPPYHVTQDDVWIPLQRLEVEKVTGHQSVHGRGGVIAVMYEMHWTGLSGPSRELEMDFRHDILRYWTGTPNQRRQTNRLYRRMRIGAAQRELSRSNGERFSAHGYGCVPRAEWLRRYSATVFPMGPTFGVRATTVCGGLGKLARARLRMGYIWCAFWTTRGQSSSFLLRRAKRPRLERYEVLGFYKYTWLAHLLGGSNVM